MPRRGGSSLANFVALIDPDPERRERFLRRVAPLAAPVEGLAAGSCSSPPFAAIWAAAADAPVSVDADPGTAIVFGTAIHGEDGARVTARELREHWREAGTRPPAPFDGFFAALSWDPRAGLIAGADLLGRFPVSFATAGDALLVGSSPELFRHHPAFRRTFDPHGLTGILLTHGLVEGRTLWSGVRRLAPGALLVARTADSAREVPQYRVPFHDRHFAEPLARHVEIVDAVLDRAVRRHVPRTPRSLLLLSGGLDSRTLAGYLGRQELSPLALTHGLPGDYETRCARAVARHLRLEHRIEERESPRELAEVRTRLRWEHLANGFSGTGGWGSAGLLAPLASTVIAGYGMDWIVGGHAPSSPTFERCFDYYNLWGMKPPVLERLLRKDRFGDAVRDTLAALERRYRATSPHEFQRTMAFALEHRQRFHVAGHAWAESFGAWPLTPGTDLAVIAAVAGMPEATLEGRGLQIALLRTRFPGLARLPIDRNSPDITPLSPSLVWRLRRRVQRRLARLRRDFGLDRPPAVERRRFHRKYDVNGPLWRSIREAAEPLRPLAGEYFERRVFDELVPPAAAHARFADGIVDAAGMRTLLGFLLWLGREADPEAFDAA